MARHAAAAPTEPIRIDYHAEPGCPSAEEFNAEVFRRTNSARLATGDAPARTFVISIERRGGSLVGSLVVRQADGTTESRVFAGPECGEVATVLALATALAIDPTASLTPRDGEGPPSSTGSQPSSDGGSTPRPAPRPKPAPPAPPDEDVSPLERPGTKNALAPWVVSAGAVLEGGITPRTAYGGAAAFGWRSPSLGGALSSVDLTLSYLRAPSHRVYTARSAFQFLYARPAACTVALRWQGDSGVAPCLGAEIGAVTGWGSDIAHGETRSRVWATIDLALRLHQALGSVAFVEAEADAVLPLTRWHYVFRDPDTRIYVVPGVAGAGSLRLGVRLW